MDWTYNPTNRSPFQFPASNLCTLHRLLLLDMRDRRRPRRELLQLRPPIPLELHRPLSRLCPSQRRAHRRGSDPHQPDPPPIVHAVMRSIANIMCFGGKAQPMDVSDWEFRSNGRTAVRLLGECATQALFCPVHSAAFPPSSSLRILREPRLRCSLIRSGYQRHYQNQWSSHLNRQTQRMVPDRHRR